MSTKSSTILFVASEIEGLLKTGGLADVAKYLPIALKSQGHHLCLIMPFYRTMARRDEATFIDNIQINIGQSFSKTIGVWQLMLDGIPVYCVEQAEYYDRAQPYSEGEYGYPDNGERFAFFNIAALEIAAYLQLNIDIIHCNDWHTALIPYLLKTHYANHPSLAQVKTVLTIHNALFQGQFERGQFAMFGDLMTPLVDYLVDGYQCINMLKVGIRFSDKLSTVSPNYAKELLTRLGAHGLHEFFQQRHSDLHGILNGCDYSDWNPATDPLLPAHFDQTNLEGKWQCKLALQQQLELRQSTSIPIFGMVCRLTEQKGFYLLLPALEKFLRHRIQVVIVGTGDSQIVQQLNQLQQRFGDKFRFINTYSNTLAHLIEAGSDFFLMPSLFEPCGLNQMYSLAYGSLPIVRGVGGLQDTVIDYDQQSDDADGLIFYQPDSSELLNTLRRALLLYLEEPEQVMAMRQRGMHRQFSWQDAAEQYNQLYMDVLN
ncbi:glycogen synthase GlgA [Celerinatantimonas yamalensis]|uniref:Glycogen synthase n=1 Tax=Celerinatantimonas yamalensis TaxID=559956 RepID=A0ABW9GA93_9GAMM